ncbi:MAG TPA: hypothetical protein VNV88_14265 [Candidatus Solibacter sp.]|jgi:hypothetical protein|nr:hypothetical protein [Candidatus Solibacter sp.]
MMFKLFLGSPTVSSAGLFPRIATRRYNDHSSKPWWPGAAGPLSEHANDPTSILVLLTDLPQGQAICI